MLKKTGPCVCTLFPSTTPTAAPFCCHFHFPRPCRRPPCATIFNSSSPIYSRFRSRTLDDPHHPRYSRFHQPPLTRFDSRFTCAVACKSRLICELLSLAIPFAGCDSHCIKFACQSLLEACTIVWMLEIWKLIGLRECPSLFYLNFAFFGDFLVSGSAYGHIASLEGVCWIFGMLCERAQCADPRNSGTFPTLIDFVRASGLYAPFLSLFRFIP